MDIQNNLNTKTAELVRADTALQSFRDGGYNFNDAIGEIVDNSIQAGARKIRFGWNFESVKRGKSPKPKREITSLAVADDGQGITATILANVLTIGFSTRYNSREGIGRFGVGFKLASISQAKRLEIYTRPAFLEVDDTGETFLPRTGSNNREKKVFMTYLDLDEIKNQTQVSYSYREVDGFPKDYQKLMEDFNSGTLIVWRNIDRMNEDKAYTESADEKISGLDYFLARTYRRYIDKGLKIFLPSKESQLFGAQELKPYDPSFQIENTEAEALAHGEPMKGEFVENGELKIDGHVVQWGVYMTPQITRLIEGGGGVKGPIGDNQFKRLHIPDNQGKISFLRYDREISYTKVPHLIQADNLDRNSYLDRHIAIEVSFPPGLDEYFQVRHIKRGVEPVEKLKKELKEILNKPVKAARKRIRQVWAETKTVTAEATPDDFSGGRTVSEETVQASNPSMPTGRAGESVAPDAEFNRLVEIAETLGIKEQDKQEEFALQTQQKPMVALEMEWAGKGLLDIEHLNRTVVVKINKRHPFIREVYNQIKEAAQRDVSEMEPEQITHLFEKALAGIDLLFFAYAKAENMHEDPEDAYIELREDWGKFTAAYLKKRNEVNIG
ncbi:Histidine kinase-, DNA gyrase B-, and HSP90-like ATPase [Pedobacter terrae]|uniref:Histidine kinase-, DNA gyrase B-, and HSP90-like ATPase n=1 Tax=Pedobacter terrae TaxID=405671 RepID=A0A1G7Q5X1_9SPHI|nr:ATP-binding protein [Pedobacter terrae]SDF93855.1 Histidine kinase-, DNA gyrase B-, and HSP90-like ATPase [Pedobacter terrae]